MRSLRRWVSSLFGAGSEPDSNPGLDRRRSDDRRSGSDRRSGLAEPPLEDRRGGGDRRSGEDRRRG